jgi:hypothetical protein
MRILRAALRVALIVLVVVVAVEVGVSFAPRLARLGAGSGTTPQMMSAGRGAVAQPDWGGGRMSFADHTPAGLIDSVKMAAKGDPSRTQTYSGRTGGVLLQQKPDSDYSLAIAMASPNKPGRTALFEVPSSGHFQKELLPKQEDAEPPAADIPLYPQSQCRMQVGRGTACFVGFYLTPDSVEAVRSFYVRALSKLGWQRVAAGSAGILETFTKRDADRAVVLQLRRQDSMTTRIGLVVTTSGNPDGSERK